jgi:ABC-type nitrate/sulfonate/bicarbonate transport system substrate-binding protein
MALAPAAVLLSVGLLAAACSSNNSSSTTTSGTGGSSSFLPSTLKGSAPSSVKIGLAGGYALNFAPVELAEGLGYYNQVAQRFHTSISFDVYGGGTTAEPAFLGGTDQFMVIGTNSWLPVVVQGKDQVGVFSEGEGLGIEVAAAQSDKATKGTDLSKFKGATWCQTGPVGTAHTAIQLISALNNLGVTASQIVSVGSVSAYSPALQSGRCEIASEDLISAASQEINKIAYVIVNTNDPATSFQLAGHQEGIPLTTSRAFANQYPKLTQAIIDATLKSLLYIQQNLDNANAIYNKLPAEAQSTYSLGTFAQAWDLFKDSLSPTYTQGGFTTSEANDTLSLLVGTGNVPSGSTIDPSTVYWNKWVYQAYSDLGLAAPKFPANLPSHLGTPSPETQAAVKAATGG